MALKYKSYRGRDVDAQNILSKNTHIRAITNTSKIMNARGDIIDKRGNIIKSAESIAAEYQKTSKTSVKQMSLNELQKEIGITPAEAIKKIKEAKAAELAKREEKTVEETKSNDSISQTKRKIIEED